jgi:hypothetical protein
MTARSSGKARRALQSHTAAQAIHARVADPDPHDVGEAFDITAYVKASRHAQHLPKTVDDPAVLERLIALLRVAQLSEHQEASEPAQE